MGKHNVEVIVFDEHVKVGNVAFHLQELKDITTKQIGKTFSGIISDSGWYFIREVVIAVLEATNSYWNGIYDLECDSNSLYKYEALDEYAYKATRIPYASWQVKTQ